MRPLVRHREAMTLSGKQKQHLRALAHKLKPVVIIGEAGLTDAVTAEADQALMYHELIKVKINSGERDDRQHMANQLCDRTGAELVQTIGRMYVIYRPGEKRRIQFP